MQPVGKRARPGQGGQVDSGEQPGDDDVDGDQLAVGQRANRQPGTFYRSLRVHERPF
ncbi:hypothetical protein [Micromonospora sp. NBC_00860]|uniref:hypothetical protein n=1 Tax=Micromonospora sp. NBC_00860 TaxID=2975980 RepID=UPI0038672AC6|nr:hypothetical protein OH804_24770 [Micromonospora sp. NBC_00860]